MRDYDRLMRTMNSLLPAVDPEAWQLFHALASNANYGENLLAAIDKAEAYVIAHRNNNQ